MKTIQEEKEIADFGSQRRSFLKSAGTGLTLTALVMACKKKDDSVTPVTATGVNLGSGDTGILNYAYALEQLEAAFYTQVVSNAKFTTIFSASEQALLKDIQEHEVIHREFFKAALAGSAIPSLQVNFTSIDFTSRTSILTTAKAFEDLGVSAYNGAGHLITDPKYLTLAGKIVSVEARHASAIRDLLSTAPLDNADFAGDDTVDATSGLDVSRTPAQVLAIAGTYLTTQINASNLPTS